MSSSTEKLSIPIPIPPAIPFFGNNTPKPPPKAEAPPPVPSSIASSTSVTGNGLPASTATLEFASILSTSTAASISAVTNVPLSSSAPITATLISISTQTQISTSKETSISTVFITSIPTPTGLSGAQTEPLTIAQSNQNQPQSNSDIPKLIISLSAVAAAFLIIIIGMLIYFLRLRKQRKTLLSTLPSFHEKDGTPQEPSQIQSKTFSSTIIPVPTSQTQAPTSYYAPPQSQELSSQNISPEIAYPGWAQFQKFRHNTTNPITNPKTRIVRGRSQWPPLFDGAVTPGPAQYQDPAFLDARSQSEGSGVPPPKYSKYKVVNRYRQAEETTQAAVDEYSAAEKSREVNVEEREVPLDEGVTGADRDGDNRWQYTTKSRMSRNGDGDDNFGLQRLSVLRARERIDRWRDVVVNTPQEIEDEVTLVDEPVFRSSGATGRIDLRREKERERLRNAGAVEEDQDREDLEEGMRPVSEVMTEVSLVSLNECLASVDDLFV